MTTQLPTWDDVSSDGEWPAILLGNGLSISFHKHFGYDSLFDAAELSDSDKALFKEVDTTNFETAMAYVDVAAFLARQENANGLETKFAARLNVLRVALAAAIESVHPEHSDVDELRPDWTTSLSALNTALKTYESVYTTSYDLIIYWALNTASDDFSDHFLPKGDSLTYSRNSSRVRRHTTVQWLHGGLHLTTRGHVALKTKASDTQTIRDQIRNSTDLPLIVTEGKAQQKLRAIYGSDYLTDCYKSLSYAKDSFDEHRRGDLVGRNRSIVVLGQSLAPCDGHLSEALRDRGGRVAYGIHGPSTEDLSERQSAVRRILGEDVDLCFFDSATHPIIECSPQQ